MSVMRVLVGAVAAIGGYLFIIAIANLARFEPSWLPYTAQLAGALIAGGALARQGARHRYESLAAGLLSVGIVSLVAFASPQTYSWFAARAEHPLFVAFAILIGCGIAGEVGARLAYGHGGTFSIVVFSTAVSSGFLFFGMRLLVLVLAHVMTTVTSTQIVAMYICAFIAGGATQAIVPAANAGACSSGIAILVAVVEIGAMLDNKPADGLLWLVLAVAVAFGGALVAQKLRQRSSAAA